MRGRGWGGGGGGDLTISARLKRAFNFIVRDQSLFNGGEGY